MIKNIGLMLLLFFNAHNIMSMEVTEVVPVKELTEQELNAKVKWIMGERIKFVTILQKSKLPKTDFEFAARINTLTFCYQQYLISDKEWENWEKTEQSKSLVIEDQQINNFLYKKQFESLNRFSEQILIRGIDLLLPIFKPIEKTLASRAKQIGHWIAGNSKGHADETYKNYKYVDPAQDDTTAEYLNYFRSHQSRYEKILKELYTIEYKLKQHAVLSGELKLLYATYQKNGGKGSTELQKKITQLSSAINMVDKEASTPKPILNLLNDQFDLYLKTILEWLDRPSMPLFRLPSTKATLEFIQNKCRKIRDDINNFALQ
jgi:hypothetical protein